MYARLPSVIVTSIRIVDIPGMTTSKYNALRIRGVKESPVGTLPKMAFISDQ